MMDALELQNIDTADYTCELICAASSSSCPGSLRRRRDAISNSGGSSDLSYVIVGGTEDAISVGTTVAITVKDHEGNAVVLAESQPVQRAIIEIEPDGDPVAFTAFALKERVEASQANGAAGGTQIMPGRSGGAIAGISIGTILAIALVLLGAVVYATSVDGTGAQSENRRASRVQHARPSIDRGLESTVHSNAANVATEVTATVINIDGPAAPQQWEPLDVDPKSKSFRTKSITRQPSAHI